MSTDQKFSRQVRNGKVVYVCKTPSTPVKPARNVIEPAPTVIKPARKAIKPVRSQSAWLPSPLQSCLNLLLLAGMASAVVGVAWLSYQVITEPDMAFWLDQYLPRSKEKHTATQQPRTLSQILKGLQNQERSPGKPIVLAANANQLASTKDILIPIYAKSCSGRPCPQIQSLQVYRSLNIPSLLRLFQSKRYYRLLDQIRVRGPKAEKLANLARNPRLVGGSTQPLPLSRIQVYHPAPKPGIWLRLTGLRSEGSAMATYGQILYFHPDEARLALMLNWASPAGEYPQWRQVTGDQQPELVVKQTVGLEPHFAVYRLHFAPAGDLLMEHISLTKPAFVDQAYSQNLLLARSGLWSPAQKGLLAVKQRQSRQWSPKAQAQLDYINLHAAVTNAQAKQTSASGVQTLVAQLVNGEWRTALKLLQSKKINPAEVRALLAADPGRLSARVEAFLKVYPQDQNAIAWGTLIRHIQDDPKTALAWAQQRTGTNKASLAAIKKWIKHVDPPLDTPKETPVVPKPKSSGGQVKSPVQSPAQTTPQREQLPSEPISPPPAIPKPSPKQTFDSEAEVPSLTSSPRTP